MPLAVAVSEVDTRQIETSFFLHKPDVTADLIKRYGGQFADEFLLIRNMGQKKATTNNVYQHSELNRYHENITVLANVASPGVNNDAFITLDPICLSPENNFYPQVTDIVTFPNGVQAQITNINVSIPSAPVLTLHPTKLGNAIPAILAGDEIAITSRGASEGSGQPVGSISWFDTYTNNVQRVKESFSQTGDAMTSGTWYKIQGVQGAAYYNTGQMQMEYRYSLRVAGALMNGDGYDNTEIDPTTGRPYAQTKGWLPTLQERGNVQVHVPGTFTPADLDENDRIFDREGVTGGVMSWQGNRFNQEVNNSLVSYFKDTNIQMVRESMETEMFGGVKGLSGTMNFKAIQKNQRPYAFKTCQYFTNPKGLGAVGYDYVNQAIWFPVGSGFNSKTKEMENFFGYRYSALDGVNREMEVFTTGSHQKVATTDLDLQNLFMRGSFGAQIFMANQQIYNIT